MRRALAVLAAFAVLWAAIPAAAAASIDFDQAAPIAIAQGSPGTAAIVNDTATPYSLTVATATALGGPSLTVSTASSGSPAAFQKFTTPVPVPAGGVLWMQVQAGDSSSAATGFLTVRLSAGHSVIFLHRALSFTPTSVAPAVTSLTRLSRAGLFDLSGGGTVSVAIPLVAGGCVLAGSTTLTLVDQDRTAPGQLECPSTTAAVAVARVHLPGPGTYKGTVSVGGKDVSIEIDRGLAPVWPILAILIGLLLAVVVQALTEADWIRQQRAWLSRQLSRAKVAADDFDASPPPAARWHRYGFSLYIKEETELLDKRINAVVSSRGQWFLQRLVPWPVGYQAKERAAIVDRIVVLDGLIADWPATAANFVQVGQRLAEHGDILRLRADGLVRTVQALLNPADAKLATGLDDVRDQVADAAAALDLAIDLDGQLSRLNALNGVAAALPVADQGLLGAAWQQYRVAAAALRASQQPVDAVNQVAPLVATAAHSIAGLPDPAAVVQREVGADQAFAATAPGTELGFRVLVPVRAVGRLIESHAGVLSFALILILNLVAGLWTGLAVLYVNKPWGHPLDFVVAMAWGFAATTVLTPLLGLLRNLGTRAGDAAPAS